MRSLCGVLISVTVLTCVLCHAALAQQPLPRSKQAALDATDKQIIRKEVARLIAQIDKGDDKEVRQARQRLIDLVNPVGSTQFFLQEFRQALAGPLRQAFNSDRDLVRINVMIVANASADPNNIGLPIAGLKDENPGVRYWSAQSAYSVAQRLADAQTQTDSLQKQLLTELDAALRAEQFEQVLQILMDALGKLTISEASDISLSAVDDRVGRHLAQPALSVAAEYVSLRELRNRIVGKPKTVPAKTKRMFTQVALRYFMLAATLFEQGKVPRSTESDYVRMLKLADGSIRHMVKHFGVKDTELPAAVANPKEIDALIKRGDWRLIKQRAEQWRQLLVSHPKLKFKNEDLKLRAPKPAE